MTRAWRGCSFAFVCASEGVLEGLTFAYKHTHTTSRYFVCCRDFVRLHTEALGEAEGAADGLAVGLAEGEAVGTGVGEALGEALGLALGEAEGEADGLALGALVGGVVGANVGLFVWALVGALVGAATREPKPKYSSRASDAVRISVAVSC